MKLPFFKKEIKHEQKSNIEDIDKKIKYLSYKGISGSKLINILKSDGYSLKEIENGLRYVIKSEVETKESLSAPSATSPLGFPKDESSDQHFMDSDDIFQDKKLLTSVLNTKLLKKLSSQLIITTILFGLQY